MKLEWSQLGVAWLAYTMEHQRFVELLHPAAQQSFYWVDLDVLIFVKSQFAEHFACFFHHRLLRPYVTLGRDADA